MGRTINQIRRLFLPSTPPLGSIKASEPTYIPNNSLTTNGDDDKLVEFPDDVDPITDDDKDNLGCQLNLNAHNYRRCKGKAAHVLDLCKIDASLAEKTLAATEAPRLNTKVLVTKLDCVTKTLDFDVSTILVEQIKDPVLGTVRSWLREGTSPDAKSSRRQQSKRPFDIFNCSTACWLRENDNYYATMNLPTNWKTKTHEFVYHYHFFYPSSDLDTLS